MYIYASIFFYKMTTCLKFQHLYTAYEASHRPAEPQRMLTAMQQFNKRRRVCCNVNAFDRIGQCRRALEALDRQGWNRSYHQRQFHEQFIRACARIFYKTEPNGTFQRDHQKLLQVNGWANLSQEILISTPRRCMCTVSFAAALFADHFSQLERRYRSACLLPRSCTVHLAWS